MMQKTASFSRTRTESETKSPRYHRRFISAFMTTSNQSFRYVEPALTKKAVESAPQYTPQVSMLASAKKLTDSFVHRNNRQYRINSFKEGLSEGSIAITTYNLAVSFFLFPSKKSCGSSMPPGTIYSTGIKHFSMYNSNKYGISLSRKDSEKGRV